mgnify:CR=1 FL=1
MDYKTDFDVIKTLEDNGLSIGNYNKALLKVKDEEKLLLNINMTKLYTKLTDN